MIPNDLFLSSSALSDYLSFLKDIRKMVRPVVRKNELFITKIESEIGKPLLNASTASEINRAIIKVAGKRKKQYNGGYIDDGTSMRFRLAQAVVCYLRWAHGEGLVHKNCYVKNQFPKARWREGNFLTDEQLAYLYGCDTLEERDVVLIRFFYDTGLRCEQVCSVKKDEIHWDKRFVKVYIPKVDKYHSAPITELTIRYLANWVDRRNIESEYLFCNRIGGRLSTASIRERFRGVSKKVGFRVNPHCFRHTSTTKILEEFGQIAAMQFAGHTDVAMTNHYVHIQAKRKVEMQDKVVKKNQHIFRPKFVFPRRRGQKLVLTN